MDNEIVSDKEVRICDQVISQNVILHKMCWLAEVVPCHKTITAH